jgi:hypothetical protein
VFIGSGRGSGSSSKCRRLTLQSRGRHPASRAPPLISNVERHEEAVAFLLLMSFRSASQMRVACVAPAPSVTARGLPPKLNDALATNRHVPKKEGQACAASAPTPRHRTASTSQFVVGASRRSAAPGSRFWGAARGGAELAHLPRPELRSTTHSRAARPVSSVVLGSAPPNYSIERTSQGLRPCAASHVKR